MNAARLLVSTLTSFLLLGLLSFTGCKEEQGSTGAQVGLQNAVLTTFYPTEYFAERIAGGLVIVDSPLPDGEDPIFW